MSDEVPAHLIAQAQVRAVTTPQPTEPAEQPAEVVSRRFVVTISGLGLPFFPYQPKYATDNGVTGYTDCVYDFEENECAVTFTGDPDVLDLIAAEPDVEEVEL